MHSIQLIYLSKRVDLLECLRRLLEQRGRLLEQRGRILERFNVILEQTAFILENWLGYTGYQRERVCFSK